MAHDDVVTQTAQIVRAIISSLYKHGESIESVARRAGLSDIAVRQFLKRTPVRYRASNVTVKKLRELILKEQANLKGEAAFLFQSYAELLSAGSGSHHPDSVPSEERLRADTEEYHTFAGVLYRSIGKLLGVEPLTYARTLVKMRGRYVCYRNATAKDYIVKSSLRIDLKPGFDDVWEFVHLQRDAFQDQRSTDGPVIALSRTLYLVGDMESGQGLEIIVLKEPLPRKFSRLRGFIITMDQNREVYSARICCLPLQAGVEPEIGIFNREFLGSELDDIEELIDDSGNARQAHRLDERDRPLEKIMSKKREE